MQIFTRTKIVWPLFGTFRVLSCAHFVSRTITHSCFTAARKVQDNLREKEKRTERGKENKERACGVRWKGRPRNDDFQKVGM